MPETQHPPRLFLLLICALFTATSNASATPSDVPGSRDPGLIERYPRSWIVEFSAEQAVDYLLVLGRIKKTNHVVAPEKSHRVIADVTRTTYRVPDGHAPQQVFEWIEDQIGGQTRELLFQCHGRACGGSNEWANQIFGIAELYGPDREQSYLLARTRNGDKQKFLVAYVIQRGNRRVYAHIDEVSVGAQAASIVHPNPVTLMSVLRQHRRVTLPALNFGEQQELVQPQGPEIELLVQALQLDLIPQVAIVAHSSSGQGIDTDLRISEARARNLVNILVNRGVDRSRLFAFGNGSLSPPYDTNLPADRVELVIP